MTTQPNRNGFNAAEDTRMHRLWNPQTRRYLHLSGEGETPNVDLSWLGYAHQARALREQFCNRGDHWPYRWRARNAGKVDVPSFEDVRP